MATATRRNTTTLTVTSISEDGIDVSVLRDFVRTLDELSVDSRVSVKHHTTEAGRLQQLWVQVVVDNDTTDVTTVPPSAPPLTPTKIVITDSDLPFKAAT